MQLPAAFRSLSRPSSAPDAKASSVRSYSLNLRDTFVSPFLALMFSFLQDYFLRFFIVLYVPILLYIFALLVFILSLYYAVVNVLLRIKKHKSPF